MIKKKWFQWALGLLGAILTTMVTSMVSDIKISDIIDRFIEKREIFVSASDMNGTEFGNNTSKMLTYKFTPSGIWQWKKDYSVGPTGSYQNADDRYILPGRGKGCLVAKIDDDYYYAGKTTEFVLKPGQKIYFMINDGRTEKSYRDNYGNIKIEWDIIYLKKLRK